MLWCAFDDSAEMLGSFLRQTVFREDFRLGQMLGDEIEIIVRFGFERRRLFGSDLRLCHGLGGEVELDRWAGVTDFEGRSFFRSFKRRSRLFDLHRRYQPPGCRLRS